MKKRKKKADFDYPFQHGEVINHTLDGVSVHLVTTKVQMSFLIRLMERKETAQGFQHEANRAHGCDRRKLSMAQTHCSYSTIVT